jgi:hypothetical protein
VSISLLPHWHDQFTKSACFLGAIQAAASKLGKKEAGAGAVVHAEVSLGRPTDRPGFGLKVLLRVEGVEDQAILDAAHEVSYTDVTTTRTNGLLVNRFVHTAALCARG